jgi:hypothetical protein
VYAEALRPPDPPSKDSETRKADGSGDTDPRRNIIIIIIIITGRRRKAI